MKKLSERTKITLSFVFLTIAGVWFVADTYPEEFGRFIVEMKSTILPPESTDEDAVPLDPVVQKPKTNKLSAKKPAEDDSGLLNLEDAGGLELLGDELVEDSLWEEGILRSRPEGIRSGQSVLDALQEIDGWSPIETGYNPVRLKLFLRYPKLWVRVSAFAFAVKAKALNAQDESRLARIITLKYRDNPTQIVRFLKRYERKDPELFEKLSKVLVKSGSPAPEEPAPLEIEEDSPDAS
jgi:hypothetical protein